MGSARPFASASVVFDLDGTLVDSRLDFAALRVAVRGLLARAGVPWPGPATAEPALSELLGWARTAAERGADAVYREAMAMVAAEERRGHEAHAMPEAARVLAALRRGGARLAILTNNARDGSMRQLDRLGLATAVDAVWTRDDVPALKPDPRGLDMALRALGSRPRAWYVGDSWIDAAAAQAIGVPFVAMALSPDVLAEHGLAPGEAHVTSLAEVLSHLAIRMGGAAADAEGALGNGRTGDRPGEGGEREP